MKFKSPRLTKQAVEGGGIGLFAIANTLEIGRFLLIERGHRLRLSNHKAFLDLSSRGEEKFRFGTHYLELCARSEVERIFCQRGHAAPDRGGGRQDLFLSLHGTGGFG